MVICVGVFTSVVGSSRANMTELNSITIRQISSKNQLIMMSVKYGKSRKECDLCEDMKLM